MYFQYTSSLITVTSVSGSTFMSNLLLFIVIALLISMEVRALSQSPLPSLQWNWFLCCLFLYIHFFLSDYDFFFLLHTICSLKILLRLLERLSPILLYYLLFSFCWTISCIFFLHIAPQWHFILHLLHSDSFAEHAENACWELMSHRQHRLSFSVFPFLSCGLLLRLSLRFLFCLI